ncbi:2-methoxy-6-polyprenyl-1,4-benzoquinol methylase, mitochondrial [subsurface metagenome]
MSTRQVWDVLVCPKCKSKLSQVDSIVKDKQECIVCKSCGKRYPLVNSIIDFESSLESELSTKDWSRQNFEKGYRELGDWDSIYDWDQKYGVPRNASSYKYARVKGKILDMLKPQTGDSILDLGCGNGYFIIQMFKKFSTTVKQLNYIGLDVSEHNVMNFLKKVEREKINNVDMFIGRAEMLPFKSDSIKWITSSEALEHIEDKELALKEVYRILAPGGTFLFSTPSEQAIRNWNIILFPFRLGYRLLVRKNRQNRAFDQPISRNKYMVILNEIGFKNIKLNTSQLLSNEIARYIPRFLLNMYISLTDIAERNSSIMRRLFGLHIIGCARK